MAKLFFVLILLSTSVAAAQPMASSYATRNGHADTVVIACPSQDGSFTAGPCPMSKPGPVTYQAPGTATISTPNVAVTVFAAGSVANGCDFVNTGSSVLYIDLTAMASAGAPTSIPLQPNQSFHCPYPPVGAVTAVAAQAQSFVAIRY